METPILFNSPNGEFLLLCFFVLSVILFSYFS
jgi:hypothetical protein